MTKPSTRDLLRELLEPVVAAHGYDLEDVGVTPAGRRRLVRVVIDGDAGVDLDDVARVSAASSAALDAADAMGTGGYVLEVSSPGVDRPLVAPRHWRRARGHLVRVALSGGGDLVGRVVDADEAGMVIDVAGSPRRLGYDEVARAQVQVEFQRASGEPAP
ncbi:MAG TPA: ribosome maturation factor RimP [Mycobacteriales bacterium]|nr:ribosome maturation factor RimP [Mycobacteriales bacterium]